MSKQTDLLTERIEDYLEMLLRVTKKKKFAQAKDISEILGVAPSSVTGMFQKMDKMGFINYQKYSGVTLTEKGEIAANEVYQKHKILENFLLTLGVNKDIAIRDACEIEHKASKETILRLKRFIEFLEKSKSSGGWIDHLYHYFETGIFIECRPDHKGKCPVHSLKELNS